MSIEQAQRIIELEKRVAALESQVWQLLPDLTPAKPDNGQLATYPTIDQARRQTLSLKKNGS